MSQSPPVEIPLSSMSPRENLSASQNNGPTHCPGSEPVSQLAQEQSVVRGQQLSLPKPLAEIEKNLATASSDQALPGQPSTDCSSRPSQGQADNAQQHLIRQSPIHDDSRHSSPHSAAVNVPTSVLQSKFKQHSTSYLLAVLASSVLAFSTWFIFTVFISEKQIPRYFRLSPGQTIIVINILTHVVVFLVWQLVDSAFEALRWTLASRDEGVLITTFLAMSRATGFIGVADLLRVPGWHRVWCVQR
jgi:hypothetical protein